MHYEIAIQAFDYPEPHRAKAGDILDIRPSRSSIGEKEKTSILWVTVDIADARIVEGLTEPIRNARGELVSKRRFSVPLARLKSINSSLDLTRVADPKDPYQPFVNVDGTRMIRKQDIPVTNLFLDKAAG